MFFTGSNETVLVKCGIFVRPVSFDSSGNKLQALTNAIVASFPGLREEYIAVLKARSEQYQRRFIDYVDSNMTIDHNSLIRVVVYKKVREDYV